MLIFALRKTKITKIMTEKEYLEMTSEELSDWMWENEMDGITPTFFTTQDKDDKIQEILDNLSENYFIKESYLEKVTEIITESIDKVVKENTYDTILYVNDWDYFDSEIKLEVENRLAEIGFFN